ncbi:flagellar basal body rod protein FlgB [Nocardioides massiliensis]|uniref:Flagellar basal body rod protein FlgB n=1 Tax=Nocardioides massiliensis TaxID=1325935 RepID=A0ABT9NN15_9ACTN|nr:flagellar basal body rod protein FlgB [Nocardioides massiliensis]MDP9821716.1 flagellar basal-body rod protein FlgB [Nocardioides massiliensis]
MPVLASDAVATALHNALNGLSLRQNVIADNIANIDTPHFRATSVDFESALRGAIADGSLQPGATTGAAATATNTPVGPNGNNVDLRKETMAAMQSVFQYQMLSRAMSDRFTLVKTAAGAM